MKEDKGLQTWTTPVPPTLYRGLTLILIVALVSSGQKDTHPGSSYSLAECHALHGVHPGAQQIVREEFGLVYLTLDIPVIEVLYQSTTFRNPIPFEEALRGALRSFMEDGTHLESPLGLIENDSFDLSEPEQKALLFEHLNRSSTRLQLVSLDTGIGTPEFGESVLDNGIFYLCIESYSDHLQWAIVDRSGKRPTYNYGFN